MLKLKESKTLIRALVQYRELITSKSELRNVTVMFRLHQRTGRQQCTTYLTRRTN